MHLGQNTSRGNSPCRAAVIAKSQSKITARRYEPVMLASNKALHRTSCIALDFTLRSSSCRQCHDSLLHSQCVSTSSSVQIIYMATKMLECMCRARSYSSGHLSWVSCSCLPWKPATGSTPIGGSAAPPRHPPLNPVQRMQAHVMLSMNHQLMLLLLLLLLLLLVSRFILSGPCHKQSATRTQA